MSRQPKINWRKSDEAELRRVVKNFNAKLGRLEKKNPQNAKFLPKFWNEKTKDFTDRLTVSQLKEIINTRQDLKREINALKRFSRRGSEDIVTIDNTEYNIQTTRWQKNEMSRRVAVINRRRKNRLEEIADTPMTSRGEDLGYTREQFGMGKAQIQNLKPMNAFTKSMTQTALKWKYKAIMSESQSDFFTKKDEELRQNYLKGIKENYDVENVQDIIDEIEKMPISDFIKVFNAEDSTLEIASPDGRLDLKHAEYEGYESTLRAIWKPNNKNKKQNVKKSKKPKKKATKRKGPPKRSKSIEELQDIGIVQNGYINVFDGRRKVAKFKTSNKAMEYLQSHKLKNFSFYVDKR